MGTTPTPIWFRCAKLRANCARLSKVRDAKSKISALRSANAKLKVTRAAMRKKTEDLKASTRNLCSTNAHAAKRCAELERELNAENALNGDDAANDDAAQSLRRERAKHSDCKAMLKRTLKGI